MQLNPVRIQVTHFSISLLSAGIGYMRVTHARATGLRRGGGGVRPKLVSGEITDSAGRALPRPT